MPRTAGTRSQQLIVKNVSKKIKCRALTAHKKHASGIGGGGKKVARFKGWRTLNLSYAIDYKRTELKFSSVVLSVFKVLHRTSFIALIGYVNGSFSYIIAQHGVRVGRIIHSFSYFIYKSRLAPRVFGPGSVVYLYLLARYSIFSNLRPLNSIKAKYARAGGTYCQMVEKFEDYNLAVVKLPTSSDKIISLDTYVTVGRNSNILNKYKVFGQAGYRRNAGRRPIVRGVARNPVDHPNGGRTKTNKPEKSLWGWVAKHNC